jgi:hypothetical protein
MRTILRDPIAILCTALALVSTACGANAKMSQLQLGMPEPKVISIMGAPDGRMREGNQEALKWSDRLMSSWSWDRADYWVVLEGGLVTAYGPGEVRQESAGSSVMLVFVPR